MLTNTTPRRLYRSRQNVVVSGVAGGIAAYFNVDPTIVRIILVLALLMATGPFAPLAYTILAMIIPLPPIEA